MSFKVAVHHFTAKNSKMLIKRKIPTSPRAEELKLIKKASEKKVVQAKEPKREMQEEGKEYMEEIKELNADILKKSINDLPEHHGRRADSVKSPNPS